MGNIMGNGKYEVVEGALANGKLLNRDAFVKYIKSCYAKDNSYFVNMEQDLNEILIYASSDLMTKYESSVYLLKEWENFQQKYLNLSTNLELMGIANYSCADGQNFTSEWIGKDNEVNLVDNPSKQTCKTATISIKEQCENNFNQAVLDRINLHFSDMKQTLNGEMNQLQETYLYLKYLRDQYWGGRRSDFFKSPVFQYIERYNKIRISQKLSWGEVNTSYPYMWLYGNIGSNLGKPLDAFMNHMFGYHKAIEYEKFKTFNPVVEEEGEYSFIDLLYNSKNNTAWNTGGDIIVVDKNNKISSNIQLKASQDDNINFKVGVGGLGNTGTLMKITSELSKLLYQSSVNNNIDLDKIANMLYDELKTTGMRRFAQTCKDGVDRDIEIVLQELLEASELKRTEYINRTGKSGWQVTYRTTGKPKDAQGIEYERFKEEIEKVLK